MDTPSEALVLVSVGFINSVFISSHQS